MLVYKWFCKLNIIINWNQRLFPLLFSSFPSSTEPQFLVGEDTIGPQSLYYGTIDATPFATFAYRFLYNHPRINLFYSFFFFNFFSYVTWYYRNWPKLIEILSPLFRHLCLVFIKWIVHKLSAMSKSQLQ